MERVPPDDGELVVGAIGLAGSVVLVVPPWDCADQNAPIRTEPAGLGSEPLFAGCIPV